MRMLITGIAGQDGSYLAELLVGSGNELLGVIHPGEALPPYLASLANRSDLSIIPCDLADPAALRHLLRNLAPERVFHLAAISQPRDCLKNPELSRQVNVVSCEVLVEWARRDHPAVRLLLLSSSNIYGSALDGAQHEDSPVNPQGEYAQQKLSVRELARSARKDGVFAACAIPFTHESERRSEDFVFAKVCNSVARIAHGQQELLALGRLEPQRDWGFAPEYVQAMAWMLDVDQPLELVLGTGESHSVEELLHLACGVAGLDPGAILQQRLDDLMGQESGPDRSLANPTRAWKELGWKAETRFRQLVERLTLAALGRYARS